jgi:hypothetical protein
VTTVDSELVDVWCLGFPLEVHLRAQEHGEGLVRELTLIAQSTSPGSDVPERLTAIVAELSSRFQGISDEPERVRDAALDRGETSIDLLYRLPRTAGPASQHLSEILDEADDYCRRGQHLLSLTTPPESLAFRRWFLGEIVRQLDGRPPTSWPDYLAEHPIGPTG